MHRKIIVDGHGWKFVCAWHWRQKPTFNTQHSGFGSQLNVVKPFHVLGVWIDGKLYVTSKVSSRNGLLFNTLLKLPIAQWLNLNPNPKCIYISWLSRANPLWCTLFSDINHEFMLLIMRQYRKIWSLKPNIFIFFHLNCWSHPDLSSFFLWNGSIKPSENRIISCSSWSDKKITWFRSFHRENSAIIYKERAYVKSLDSRKHYISFFIVDGEFTGNVKETSHIL